MRPFLSCNARVWKDIGVTEVGFTDCREVAVKFRYWFYWKPSVISTF